MATRQRILEATYARVAREGLARTTVEGVAQEGGMARATIYRHFPGGRDELVQAVVSWEVGEFFARLAEDTADAANFGEWLARGVSAARRRLDEHQVLQHALELEAEQLMPRLVGVMPIVLGMLREELAERLATQPLRPEVDRGEAADVLARLMLSFMGSPGCWRLDDSAEVDRLVRDQLLAGILAPTPTPE